jgi:hypothetical protein
LHRTNPDRGARSTRLVLAGALLALGASLCAPALRAQSIVLDIPATHPRLWFGDPARLAQARAWYATHPIAIPGYPPSAAARNHALRYQMSGDTSECDPAIDWLLRFSFELADQDGDGEADPGACDLDSEGLYCDRARWFGEDAILTYDWCHAQMTPAERSTIVDRWNRYIGALNAGPYGWQERPINNYYWGFLRNSLLFGIAAMGESQRAQEFIDHALTQRFERYFLPWAQSFGRGGIPGEGTQYGPYPFGYSVIALMSAADYGYDAHAHTPYFGDATYYLNYATTPAPTLEPGRGNAEYEMFPFGDDQDFDGGGSALHGDYADLLGGTILRDPASDRARHARAWFARTGMQPSWWVRAALAGQPTNAADDDLPLDYFAAGYRFLYARSDHRADATVAAFEFGALGAGDGGGTEHNGQEAGSFQLWRRDRFVSRESAGYRNFEYVKGLDNGARVSIDASIAHNTLLFEGRGQIDPFHAQPQMLRLQSAPDYSFAAVNLRPGYRLRAGVVPQSQCWLVDEDWPFTDVAIRETLFLRDWDVLLVLDRMKASGDSLLPVYANPCTDVDYTSKPADAVRKTFVLHYPRREAPTVDGRRVSAPNGPQAFDAHLLLPALSTPRIIDERSCTGCSRGQYRLEVDQTGSAEGYFLNVLHARDAAEAPLTVLLSTEADGWRVHLTRGNGATAIIRLRSGLVSQGGSVRFGNGPEQPLYEGVQGMQILPQGPVWETLAVDQLFRDGFEAR